ncbi:MAG TPA: glycosyltransferase [Planctomycetota bacterium]|jgi:glycosyltransferase involved in cell wall biosynthesis
MIEPSFSGPEDAQQRRLRVLVITSLFPNPVQPAWGIFNAQACQRLARLDDVRVISPIKWFPGLALLSETEQRLAQVPTAGEYDGIPVSHPRFFRTPGFGLRWHGWFYRRSLQRHVTKMVQEFQPDILLAPWAYPDGLAATIWGRQWGLPVVVKCLGSDIHRNWSIPYLKSKVLEALSGSQRIVTVSDSLLHLIAQAGIPLQRIDCVYNGLDRALFHPADKADARRKLGLPAGSRVILCVAALLPIKSHGDLLQAFSLLQEIDKRDLRLVLVGTGPLLPNLRQQALRLGISARVLFAGGCRHEEIPTWMAASDVVALSSANEGLPNVLVEALACGRPVVATRVGGIPELLTGREFGTLAPAHDPQAFAAALEEVLSAHYDAATLSACPHVVSWEDNAQHMHRILCETALAYRSQHQPYTEVVRKVSERGCVGQRGKSSPSARVSE